MVENVIDRDPHPSDAGLPALFFSRFDGNQLSVVHAFASTIDRLDTNLVGLVLDEYKIAYGHPATT